MINSDPVTVLFVAAIGLAMGSFCNVVIHRLPVGESVVRPIRSGCPSCGAPVRALHNFPVLSWLALKGRARCCRAAISAVYPLVEVAVAALFALIGARVVPWELLLVVLPFAAGAVCVTVIDVVEYRIPHALSAALAVLAVAGSTFVAVAVEVPPAGEGWTAFVVPVACGLVAWAGLFLLHRVIPRGMGAGDANLAFSVGVVVAASAGPAAVLVAGFVAVAAAAVVGVVMIAVRAWRRRDGSVDRRIPFGPFLALGALVAVLWGQWLWDAYRELLG